MVFAGARRLIKCISEKKRYGLKAVASLHLSMVLQPVMYFKKSNSGCITAMNTLNYFFSDYCRIFTSFTCVFNAAAFIFNM
jgi:hypothetical protein